MKLVHITIQTNHFDEELHFYQTYVGMSIQSDLRPAGKPIVFLADTAGDTQLELIENPDADNSGNEHLSIGFQADSLDALRMNLEQDGLAPSPMISPMPQVRFFFVKDPAGVNVQFI